ncbi:MAG: DUF58 domain-containing protein [Planctomycetota bacterium]
MRSPAPSRRYVIRTSGWLFIALTALVGVGAIHSQNNLLFLLLGFCLSAILFSGVVSGAILMNIEVTRHPVGSAQVGEPWTVRYDVHNSARWVPAFALLLREVGVRTPGDVELFPELRASLSHLGPGRRAVATARARPVRRGPVRLSTIEISSGFPFGILRKSVEFAQPAQAVVRPELTPGAAPSEPDAKLAREGAVLSPDRRAAAGEFFGLREYVPGDAPRLVAWKATARLGEPVTRQLVEPPTHRVVLELRAVPRGVAVDPGAEAEIACVAGAAAGAIDHGWAVGLRAPAFNIGVEPAAGRAQLAAVLDLLGGLDLTTRPSAKVTEAAA